LVSRRRHSAKWTADVPAGEHEREVIDLCLHQHPKRPIGEAEALATLDHRRLGDRDDAEPGVGDRQPEHLRRWQRELESGELYALARGGAAGDERVLEERVEIFAVLLSAQLPHGPGDAGQGTVALG